MSKPPASVTVVDLSGSETVNPTSSSVVETDTVRSATPSKSSSVIAETIESVRLESCVPSIILSSTPVTVTFVVSQFADVNVMRLVTAASPVSDEEIERTTLMMVER